MVRTVCDISFVCYDSAPHLLKMFVKGCFTETELYAEQEFNCHLLAPVLACAHENHFTTYSAKRSAAGFKDIFQAVRMIYPFLTYKGPIIVDSRANWTLYTAASWMPFCFYYGANSTNIIVDFAFFSASGKPRVIMLESVLRGTLLVVVVHQPP